MLYVPVGVSKRVKSGLKQYQKILLTARKRDVNESDTVKIVEGILTDVLGWDKWNEITSEYKIRNQYCDLATKIGDTVHFLIEVKAIGLDLKKHHLTQLIHYASDSGIVWILLTNGHYWEAYKVLFEKPINCIKVFEIDLLEVNPSDKTTIEKLYLITREGIGKSAINQYHKTKLAINRYTIAGTIFSEPIVKAIRRELNRAYKGIGVKTDEIEKILLNDTFKREIIESDELKAALRKTKSAQKK